ncbi:ribonuclease HII [Candidatus Nomurabacteria bacterium]|nr:ribonuclease HII [Candidatus Nomurabacteria bacterium]
MENENYLIGVDEVGRGCVAGPIVAAACLSRGLENEDEVLKLVKDSKKLTAKKREELFELLKNNFIWAYAEIDGQEIDKIGIQPANCLVVERAVEKLILQLENFEGKILADHIGGAQNYVKNKKIEFHIKGESKFSIIAAASILAKVYRDNLLMNLGEKYSKYNFSQHKGYGTKEHLELIAKHGVSDLHRISFLKKYLK